MRFTLVFLARRRIRGLLIASFRFRTDRSLELLRLDNVRDGLDRARLLYLDLDLLHLLHVVVLLLLLLLLVLYLDFSRGIRLVRQTVRGAAKLILKLIRGERFLSLQFVRGLLLLRVLPLLLHVLHL